MKTKSVNYDILIVDDDIPTVIILTMYFELIGCSCLGVPTGDKALKELKKFSPKMMLIKVLLPDILIPFFGLNFVKKVSFI